MLFQIFHIPTDVLLHLFLIFSSEIREFCDFYNSVPDDSTYKDRNSMLIYDTSGLKPKVKENNPNTLVSEINKQNRMRKPLIKKITMHTLRHIKTYLNFQKLILI